jgi:hypothetical protein
MNQLKFLIISIALLNLLSCKKKEIEGIIIGNTLFENQTIEENKKLDTIILKTLNGDYNFLRRLNHFQCGDGAGCYDKGYIITQVIYKLGETEFIKMVEKLDEKELYGIENYIVVGLEYGDNDYDGEIDNKKIEIEFPKLLKVLKSK